MKKKHKPFNKKSGDLMDEDVLVSSNECTGLIPSIPENDDQIDAYSNLYPIPSAERGKENKKI